MQHLRRLRVVEATLGTLVLSVVFVVSEPLTTPDIPQGRDLSLYETGGEYHASEPIDSSRHHGKIPHVAALRRFISQHWHAKRRGYATLTESGIDAAWTTHIFIEPTETADWHIVLRIVSRGFQPTPEGGTPYPDIVSEHQEVCVLRHAPRKRNDTPGAAEVLVFCSKDGKEVWRL